MTTSLRATASLASLATAMLAGCAGYQQNIYVPPYQVRQVPTTYNFPQTQTFETRLAWKGPETLGNCVGTERASAAPIPAGAATQTANALQMDGSTRAAFEGMQRTGLTIACGYGNPMAEVDNGPQRTVRPAPRSALPAFNNVRIAHTGDYLLSNATQCKATLVMVQPESLQPGSKMPELVHGPRTLPEFGGYQLPAGWAVAKQAINYAGRSEGSGMLCTHATFMNKPEVLGIKPQ